jgi:hypothetical protein
MAVHRLARGLLCDRAATLESPEYGAANLIMSFLSLSPVSFLSPSCSVLLFLSQPSSPFSCFSVRYTQTRTHFLVLSCFLSLSPLLVEPSEAVPRLKKSCVGKCKDRKCGRIRLDCVSLDGRPRASPVDASSIKLWSDCGCLRVLGVRNQALNYNKNNKQWRA